VAEEEAAFLPAAGVEAAPLPHPKRRKKRRRRRRFVVSF